MDRFIAGRIITTEGYYTALKSNMDRFIVLLLMLRLLIILSLKSNMDRFIAHYLHYIVNFYKL